MIKVILELWFLSIVLSTDIKTQFNPNYVFITWSGEENRENFNFLQLTQH